MDLHHVFRYHRSLVPHRRMFLCPPFAYVGVRDKKEHDVGTMLGREAARKPKSLWMSSCHSLALFGSVFCHSPRPLQAVPRLLIGAGIDIVRLGEVKLT